MILKFEESDGAAAGAARKIILTLESGKTPESTRANAYIQELFLQIFLFNFMNLIIYLYGSY
jgi:hypothetical protein